MKLEERQRGLLDLVEEYRDRECEHILGQAKGQAGELLRRAYARNRAHLHERVLAERSRAQARIQAARAERSTRERRFSERTSVDLLAAAWPLLREGLRARWHRSEDRRLWTRTYLDQALRVLPRGRWTVRHAPEWVEAERAELLTGLLEELGEEPGFETDAGIEAGLIIACGGAMLDASLDGLLRDRPRMEARLLALMEEGAGQ